MESAQAIGARGVLAVRVMGWGLLGLLIVEALGPSGT